MEELMEVMVMGEMEVTPNPIMVMEAMVMAVEETQEVMEEMN